MRQPLPRTLLPALGLCLLLSGCIAKTAVDIVTAPVKVASKAVDLATTSQSEADEKRGRDLRKREERYGELERDWTKENKRCENGRRQSCEKRDELYTEMEQLRPTLPQRYAD